MRYRSLCAIALLTATCLFMAGCQSSEKENEGESITEITDLSDESFVNLYGRNATGDEGTTFFNAASGFEVRFYGTSLAVEASAYGTWDSMFSVFVDGEKDARVVTVTTGGFSAASLTLAENLAEGEHTVKALKRTDSYRSATVIEKIRTDGKFLSPPARPALKIQFFGDSITNGSGVLRQTGYDAATGRYTDSNVYTAATQNGLLSYAYVAAERLGAEAQYYGRGGIAMNYSTDERTVLNNPAALAVDLDPDDYPYDYASWTPDVVVIYLGTNDYNIGTKNPTLGYSPDGLKVAFVQFLRSVIGAYYGTEIPVVLCSGMMVPAAGLGDIMESVKRMLPEFTNLQTLEFSPCAIGHPVAEEDRVAGELLATKISEMLGL